MVRFSLTSLLIVGASAAPELLQLHPRMSLAERAACNRDNCFRQIAASATPGGPARGSAGCAAVLATTVTPCPVTSTATATATATTTSNVGVTVSSTATVTSPTTTTTTVTVTVTSGANAVPAKRTIEARITPACSAVSSSSTAIHTYASSCHNLAQYSSACSCNRIAGSATTLPPVTSTTTSTTTTTVTVTNTITTVYNPTVTITPTVTATATTTTAVVPAPTCTSGVTCVDDNSYNVQCGVQGTFTNFAATIPLTGIPNYSACLQSCSNDPACQAFNFNTATNECDLYDGADFDSTESYTPNPQFVTGYYVASC